MLSCEGLIGYLQALSRPRKQPMKTAKVSKILLANPTHQEQVLPSSLVAVPSPD